MRGGEQRRVLPGQEECCSLQSWQPAGWVAGPLCVLKFSSLTFPLRVLTALQVPRVWLVRGASLVCPDSVVREGSPACPGHR